MTIVGKELKQAKIRTKVVCIKDVDKVMKELKKTEQIVSPKPCFEEPAS